MKHLLKNKYKSIVCILLGMFLLTQVSNAYAHFWWGAVARAVFGQAVKQGAKTAVKRQASRTAFGRLATGVNVAGVALPVFAMSGSATASNYSYNEHGAVLLENGYKIYLGRGCEAESELYGKEGQWGWSYSKGFVVALSDGKEITVVEYSRDMLPEFSQEIIDGCRIKE